MTRGAPGEFRSAAKEDDLVRRYLQEIGQYPRLTQEDEARLNVPIRLSHRFAHLPDIGITELVDEEPAVQPLPPSLALLIGVEALRQEANEARLTMYQANLRLVVSIAKRYQYMGLPLPDLIQEGNMGMMHAVEKYDARKGFKFSTYATSWIRQALGSGLINTSRTIRLPVPVQAVLTSLAKAQSDLRQEKRREPSKEELAERIGITVEKLEKLQAQASRAATISLNAPVDGENDRERSHLVVDPEAQTDATADMIGMRRDINMALDSLDDRERKILRLHFGWEGEPMKLEDIGHEFNISKERVRQIQAKALAKLCLTHPHLRGYL